MRKLLFALAVTLGLATLAYAVCNSRTATCFSALEATGTGGAIKVSTATTSSVSLCLGGAVAGLPTSGYTRGCMVFLTTDNKVYVATETVTGTVSWQAIGAQ